MSWGWRWKCGPSACRVTQSARKIRATSSVEVYARSRDGLTHAGTSSITTLRASRSKIRSEYSMILGPTNTDIDCEDTLPFLNVVSGSLKITSHWPEVIATRLTIWPLATWISVTYCWSFASQSAHS